MSQTSYAYAVARIRALENRLLSRDKIERMVDAPAAADVLKMLSEQEFGAEVDLADPRDYERMLHKELALAYQIIRSITPDQEATDLFLLKYDIHNLKVLLKARYLEEDPSLLLSDNGTIPVDTLKNAASSKDYRWLPSFMKEALDGLENALSLKVDPQKIDTALDNAYYDFIASVKMRAPFLTKFFTMQVDLINLRSLLRVKMMGESFDFLHSRLLPGGALESSFFARAVEESYEQLIDRTAYGAYAKATTEGIEALIKTGRLTVFERLMDNMLLAYARSSKSNPFGIEAIVGYLLAKEYEIKLVRLILVAKINQLTAERIRERLREGYV